VRRHPAALLLVLTGVLAMVFAAAACTAATRSLTVTHGAVTPVGVIPGPSGAIGTVRVFHAPTQLEGGGAGTLEATMTTTAVDSPTAGTEIRVTMLNFTFGNGADQLIVQGSATYPSAGSTISVSDTAVRPVVGGSGIYAGARGSAESTHLADGTWKHVFRLLP
jgi:hypothetical protein